jgi:hypothetical protein
MAMLGGFCYLAYQLCSLPGNGGHLVTILKGRAVCLILTAVIGTLIRVIFGCLTFNESRLDEEAFYWLLFIGNTIFFAC